MQVVAPDILEDVRHLSMPLLSLGAASGLLLWITGWWAHRFWIVLLATISAGIAGMLAVTGDRTQPVIAGVLLALAAGLLALALVRVLAFCAGGAAAWLAMHAFAPGPWDDPLLCFLAGGLAGLLLFRFWTMILTSGAGSLLLGYFGLALAERLGRLDCIELAKDRASLINICCD